MAISTFITKCDLDACKGGASGEDQVKLMAVLRLGCLQETLCWGLGIEERVTDTEAVMTAKL